MKTKAIRIHRNSGPEVLKWEEIALADPDEGEILLSQQVIGSGVKDFQLGERVAYAGNPPGAYAEECLISVHRL